MISSEAEETYSKLAEEYKLYSYTLMNWNTSDGSLHENISLRLLMSIHTHMNTSKVNSVLLDDGDSSSRLVPPTKTTTKRIYYMYEHKYTDQ